MTLVTGTLPYDIANLLGGASRVVVSDDSAALPAVPTKLQDIINCTSPYLPKTGWVDIGATADATTYRRELTSEGWEIQQVNGTILEDVTDVARSMTVPMADFRPEFINMLEEASGVTSIAAATGAVSQKAVKGGTITQLTTRRVALIGQRKKDSGLVTETTGSVKRGRFVACVLYLVQLAADAVEVGLAKGAMSSAPVTFVALPESSQPQGQEYNLWLSEDTGTIA